MSSIIRADRWQDSNGVAYNSVLQVVSTTKTDTFSTTSTSYTDLTGMTVTITPRFTTSKILVVSSMNVGSSGAGPITGIKLLRDSTDIFVGDADGVKSRGAIGVRVDNEYQLYSCSVTFLDSPATTSATTYKFQMKSSSGTSYLNRIHNALNDAGVVRTASSITVMEIAQ